MRHIILFGLLGLLLLSACNIESAHYRNGYEDGVFDTNETMVTENICSYNWTNEDVELKHLATLMMFTANGESIKPYLDSTNISDEVVEVYICYLENILTEKGD